MLVGVGDHDASPNGNVLPVARIATVDGEITADGLTNLQRLHGHFWSGLISYQWLFQEYLFRYGSGFDGYSGLFAWRDWYILHGLDELEQLHHSVLDAGAQLVLVMLPDDLPGRNSEIIPREAPFPYEPQHFCSYARQWAADNGVPVLEPARAVRRFDYDEVMLDSMHFNNRGHKIVGDYLFDELVARKLIPAGRY